MGQQATIEVVGANWDGGNPVMVQAVLGRAAERLLRHLPSGSPLPIRVRRSTIGVPWTSYETDEDGAHAVYLTAAGNYWVQMAYQLSHELCHILCGHWRQQWDEEKWFEEAICETASLFVLRDLELPWRNSPPFDASPGYAPEFSRYAQSRLEEPHRRLPSHLTLAAWYRMHRDCLRPYRYVRSASELVSTHLLPLFESDPANWGALRYLTRGDATKDSDLAYHLRMWHRHACHRFRPFVVAVARLLGVACEAGVE